MAQSGLRWRITQAVRRRLLGFTPDHPVIRTYHAIRAAPPVRAAWRLLAGPSAWRWFEFEYYSAQGGAFAPGPALAPAALPDHPVSEEEWERVFYALIQAITAQGPAPSPVPGRIVLINNGLSAGGAERQIVYTLKGLQARGRDAHFLGEVLHAAPGHDFLLKPVQEAGVPAREPTRIAAAGNRLYADVGAPVAHALSRLAPGMIIEILDMARELKELRPAIAHLWQDETSIKHAISALMAGVPRIVLSGRNLNPTHFAYFRPTMRGAYRALARAGAIAFSNNSHAGAASYRAWLGLPDLAIKVVHNGFDAGELQPLHHRDAWRARHGVAREAPLVAGVFRLSPEKRPLLWLEAAAHFATTPVRFALLGDGPMRGEVKAFIAAQGLGEKVLLLGESRDVASALAAADAFLLTSAQEGLPNVLLEAQAFGLPCLTAPAGGAPEAIAPGRTGLILADDHPEAIAQALRALLEDAPLRALARREGPLFVAEAFGRERMIDQTLDLYGLS